MCVGPQFTHMIAFKIVSLLFYSKPKQVLISGVLKHYGVYILKMLKKVLIIRYVKETKIND